MDLSAKTTQSLTEQEVLNRFAKDVYDLDRRKGTPNYTFDRCKIKLSATGNSITIGKNNNKFLQKIKTLFSDGKIPEDPKKT